MTVNRADDCLAQFQCSSRPLKTRSQVGAAPLQSSEPFRSPPMMQKTSFLSILFVGASLLLVQETVAGDLAMRLASYPYMPIWIAGNQADVRVEDEAAPTPSEDMEMHLLAAREATKRVRYLLDRLYAVGRRR